MKHKKLFIWISILCLVAVKAIYADTLAVRMSYKDISDSHLNIEGLKHKYPKEWFHERFGYDDGCTSLDGVDYEKYPYCKVELILEELDIDGVKNLFVNWQHNDHGDIRVPMVAQYIFQKKYFSDKAVQDFIFSKEILFNMAPTMDYRLAPLIPTDLPFYKELVLEMLRHDTQISFYVPSEYVDAPDALILRIQENLKEQTYTKKKRKKLISKLRDLKIKKLKSEMKEFEQ